MNTALWRRTEANLGTQNTLAATIGQSIGRRRNKMGLNKTYCYHHASWSGFTSFRWTSSTGRCPGLTQIFPSLTVSSRSSYSVPFDSSFLKNLLYPFFPSLSDSRIFSVNVNPRCVWQTNSLFTVNIYNTKQLVTCFNVIPFRWGLYCTRHIGMLSPVPLQPVGTLER